jgi:hypothetical protein
MTLLEASEQQVGIRGHNQYTIKQFLNKNEQKDVSARILSKKSIKVGNCGFINLGKIKNPTFCSHMEFSSTF